MERYRLWKKKIHDRVPPILVLRYRSENDISSCNLFHLNSYRDRNDPKKLKFVRDKWKYIACIMNLKTTWLSFWREHLRALYILSIFIFRACNTRRSSLLIRDSNSYGYRYRLAFVWGTTTGMQNEDLGERNDYIEELPHL